MKYDNMFKETLLAWMTEFNARCDLNSEVGSANRSVDAVVELNERLKLVLPFKHCEEICIIEFKSEVDKFTEKDIYALFSKGALYIEARVLKTEHRIAFKNCTLLFMLGGNKRISTLEQSEFIFHQLGQGIHKCTNIGIWNFLVVELDLLEYTNENVFFSVFATEPIRKRVVKQALLNRDNDKLLYTIVYFLYRKEVIEMAEQLGEKFDTLSAFLRSRVEDHGGLKTLFLEYTTKEIIKIMGTKEAINAIGTKKAINAIGTKKAINAIGTKKAINAMGTKKAINAIGANEILKNLDLEVIKNYLKKIQKEKV